MTILAQHYTAAEELATSYFTQAIYRIYGTAEFIDIFSRALAPAVVKTVLEDSTDVATAKILNWMEFYLPAYTASLHQQGVQEILASIAVGMRDYNLPAPTSAAALARSH